MNKNSLTITDNRNGNTYELAITDNTIRATDLRKIKKDEADFGLMSYDPGLTNTAAARSAITFVDGEKGILRYRGYNIEDLARKSSYLEVAHLLIFGKLPTAVQLVEWEEAIKGHTLLHTNILNLISTFRYDAHPMSLFISSIASLSTLYPDSRNVLDKENRRLQIERIVAKVATIAACAYRHNQGWQFNLPDNKLKYVGNFLNMMFRMTNVDYEPEPVLEKALNLLFILHADHEQNCSTTAMRVIGSAQADPYSALAGATAALYGPLHGAANELVLSQLEEIGNVTAVPQFLEKVKKGQQRLMGFGHRIYKNYDPRCRIIKKTAEEVFRITGSNKLLDIALELEKEALEDDYFISRKLFPNVDFYSGLIYQAMKLPSTLFTVMFALPRTAGWLAHWLETFDDPEQKLMRPRQIYTGSDEQGFVYLKAR